MSMQFIDRTPPEGGENQTMLAVTGDSVRLTPVLIPDDSAMVFSVWCQAAAAATIQIIGGDTQESVEVGTGWSRAVVEMAGVEDVVLTVPSGKTVYFYKAQLETGTRVTDWKPAPEDTDAEIAGIQVGGTNLYSGTMDFSGESWSNISSWSADEEQFESFTVMKRASWGWNGLGQEIEAHIGEIYTLSGYLKADSGSTVIFYAKQSGAANVADNDETVVEVGTDWNRVSVSFRMLADATIIPRFENSVEDKYLYVCGLKLERGNRATDWTPTTQDVQDQIDTAQAAADEARLGLQSMEMLRVGLVAEPDAIHIRPMKMVDGKWVADMDAMNLRMSSQSYRIVNPHAETAIKARDGSLIMLDRGVIVDDAVIENVPDLCVVFRMREEDDGNIG